MEYRKAFGIFAWPFAAVSAASLLLFFVADQSLDAIQVSVRFTEVWLDSIRNTLLQTDRCLSMGGVECAQIGDRLKPPLAYVRALKERDRPHPDDRVLREALEEAGSDSSPLRFRLHWFETISQIAGLGVRDARSQSGSTLQSLLRLIDRAKAAREKAEPDAAEIASLRRQVNAYAAAAETGRTEFLRRASEAALRLRRILYCSVIGGVLIMFLVASRYSRRLFAAWEAKETQFRDRDQALSTELRQRVDELDTALRERGGLLAEVERHRAQLESTVRERTAELVEARDEALAASRSKTVFLASMSHELRTPLNAILGFSDVVMRDPNLPENHRRDLAIVSRSGEHLLALIDDVLDLAKVEVGGARLKISSCDVYDLLNDMVGMLRERTTAKNLTLELEIGAEVPRFIRTDPGKLRQVLTNLIANALKYTEQGGVSVRAHASFAEPGQYALLRFEIEDTGISTLR